MVNPSSTITTTTSSSSSKSWSETVTDSLRPPRRQLVVAGQERNRFSHLLLEYGERQLQDWAVIASSSSALYISNNNQHPQPCHIHPPPANGASSSFSSPISYTLSSSTIMSSSSCTMRKMEGRLRLCSLSLVFEPNDWSRGIIRCPFKYMDGPPALSEENDTVLIKFSRHFVMKTGNVIAPFDTIEQITVFRFSFLHSSPHLFLTNSQVRRVLPTIIYLFILYHYILYYIF